MLSFLFIVPTFEENRKFMTGVFFIQSIFTDQNKKFQQNFLYPIEDIAKFATYWTKLCAL